ncbi:N-acetylglucosamine kinase [Hymenobacter sp. PAMC 26628]|uniref:N-acetylglucosamine kinase n=1 Tax=Hymenobacter sp. PAMC 26628 TaxID=1484118 RepID=UPI000770069E|nr:N-acetylglucosamine kinase [Hymenobacter sp. PAMC 26628]AMJ65125.1 N-acetylglucosamine kinase [Hymenobacter sp. PAMC 26628]
MVLLADSGSTTCSWHLLGAAAPLRFTTEGYNPYFVGTEAIAASLARAVPAAVPRAAVRAVHFYGAGVLSPTKAEVVAGALRQVFPRAQVHVAEDLLAAARALLGHAPGFAAILGTGTNSCLFDGEKITHVVESLGYSLGDEGAGTYLGRLLLRDYLRGRVPAGLAAAMQASHGLGDLSEVLDRLYSQPLPNRFLASFARLAREHYHEPYCQAAVAQTFEAFFLQIVTHYPDYQRYAFNCVGSVGYHFRDALAAAAARHGMAVGRIIQGPIDALAAYHRAAAAR